MSYPKKLLRLRPIGLVLDPPPSEVVSDFWTQGQDVIFRDGLPQRVGGRRAAYTQSDAAPVYRLLNVRAPGGITESNFWLAFGEDTIDALETSNKDDVTGSALTAVSYAWQWAATLLNNIPCFTNGLDTPRYWAGDVGMGAADLPGWPAGTICKSLVAFKFHLFALDIDSAGGHFESQILWSDAAPAGSVPSTWTAAATNEAGDAVLADTPGPCMCGLPLQDTLLIFKRASTYGVVYGGPSVFSVRLLDGTRGALTRHSAVDIGGRAFVVSDGDIFLTDGTNWQSIATARVRKFLFSQLDQDNYENLFVEFDRAHGEVWVFFPSNGQSTCDYALVYNPAFDAWALRTIPDATCAAIGVINDLSPDESWDNDSGAWDGDASAWNSANFSLAAEQMMVGASDGALTILGTDDAYTVEASLTRQDLTMGEPERLKFVRRVHIRMRENSGTLYVRVGSRMALGDSIAWENEQAVAGTNAFANFRCLGRFISVAVRSVDDDVWQLGGLDLEYELRGYL